MASYANALMPGESGGMVQDVSTQPVNDTMAQLELQRRLKMAQALQEQAMPEGQMVSGHYVAPSWTQSLANIANKYIGTQQEKQALNDYGQYQKSQQAKIADLLKPQTVETPVDYNEAGNIPGMTQTTQRPLSQQEFMSRAVQAMPELAPELVKNQIASYAPKAPIKGSAGDVFFDPNTHEQIFAVPPKKESMFGKINPSEYTPESIAKFSQTENPSDLQAINKPRSVQFEKVREGTKEVTYQINSDGTRKKVATGEAFAPEKPQPDFFHLNTNTPMTNSKGWVLHTDANGNKAYVSPDGKSFEEAK